jgi:hypothetical protein
LGAGWVAAGFGFASGNGVCAEAIAAAQARVAKYLSLIYFSFELGSTYTQLDAPTEISLRYLSILRRLFASILEGEASPFE